jgi:histone acetyltransferase MYST2
MQAERSKKPEMTAALKEQHQQHREQYDMSREPLLTGLTSEFDLKLFREAQIQACEQLVWEFLGVVYFDTVYSIHRLV